MKIQWLCKLPTFAVFVVCFIMGGCIERSTVIKVKKDGTGIVHIRQHEQEVSISFGGKVEKVDEEEDSPLPTTQEIEDMASSLGDVELVSAEESVNRNGWNGYDLIFRFENINDLVLPEKLVGLDTSNDKDAAADSASSDAVADSDHERNEDAQSEDDAQGGGYRFEMVDGVLIVQSDLGEDAEEDADQKPQIGAVDPFADSPPAPEAKIDLQSVAIEQMMAAALSDMRIGVFVQVDGDLESSNATFRDGNLITLLSVNVGDVLKDPDAKQHMASMKYLKGTDRRRKMQEISAEVDGLDVDLQDRIIVEYK